MEVSSFDFSLISISALVVFVAYFFGGIVDSVCGGGGLITVPALMAIGMPMHMVVGTNHCSAIVGCFTSYAGYARAGKVDYRAALYALPFAALGALAGSKLNLIMDEHTLQIIMVFLVPALAIFTMLKKDVGEEDHSDEVSSRQRAIRCAFIGLLVTTYHSFYGPASGAFFLISFAVLLKFDAVKAGGTSRLLLCIINVITSFVYFSSGNLCLTAVLVATVSYIIGNICGVKLALSKGVKVIKPVYYCVLCALTVKLIVGLL